MDHGWSNDAPDSGFETVHPAYIYPLKSACNRDSFPLIPACPYSSLLLVVDVVAPVQPIKTVALTWE